MTKQTCCVCGDEFTGVGYNPAPFDGVLACADCNDRFVIPACMCLGRDYKDKGVLTLLQTFCELGKVLRRMNTTKVEINEQTGKDHVGRPN